MVDGVHFRLGQVSWADAGHRALAAALSDLAAMGVAPGEAHLAVALPDGAELEDALALHAAAAALAEETATVLVGGDVTRGPALTIAAFAGEDYELCFCAPPEAREAVERAGRVTWIGRASNPRSGDAAARFRAGGRPLALRGFEHVL